MTRTRNYYTTTRNYTDHSTFGGYISEFDFSGHPTLSDIANKIFQDKIFDEQCRKNAEARESQKKYKCNEASS